MSPEEMTTALGPGWERNGLGWERVVSVIRPAVFVLPDRDEWAVEFYDGGPRRVVLSCSSPEEAVDVAHLLATAERVAGGANVAGPEEFVTRPTAVATTVGFERPVLVNLLVQMEFTPRKARRAALDLLRAADDAEAG